MTPPPPLMQPQEFFVHWRLHRAVGPMCLRHITEVVG